MYIFFPSMKENLQTIRIGSYNYDFTLIRFIQLNLKFNLKIIIIRFIDLIINIIGQEDLLTNEKCII